MEYLISPRVTRAVQAVTNLLAPVGNGDEPASAADDGEAMCCTCDVEHYGRPVDYLGCGAYWGLGVERS